MEIELYHHGVKGMKWGIRRYQKKDGSLTLAGKKRRRQAENEQAKKKQEQETTEQRRARLLKSNNAQELYENRHLLSTAEINERLTRIDTEKRLGAEAEKSKQTFAKKVDKVLAVGKKVNEAYEFMNTPVMKALRAKLKGEEAKPEFDINKVWQNKDKMSTQELKNVAERMKQEAIIKGYMDKRKKKNQTDDSNSDADSNNNSDNNSNARSSSSANNNSDNSSSVRSGSTAANNTNTSSNSTSSRNTTSWRAEARQERQAAQQEAIDRMNSEIARIDRDRAARRNQSSTPASTQSTETAQEAINRLLEEYNRTYWPED